MSPQRFRKKPVVIEAMLVAPDTLEVVAAWCGGEIKGTSLLRIDRVIDIQTLEGEMRAQMGDWIIKGVKGEFYPCKPDIFEAIFRPARLLDIFHQLVHIRARIPLSSVQTSEAIATKAARAIYEWGGGCPPPVMAKIIQDHIEAARVEQKESATCKCVEQGYPEEDCKWHGKIAQLSSGVALPKTEEEIAINLEKEIRKIIDVPKFANLFPDLKPVILAALRQSRPVAARVEPA